MSLGRRARRGLVVLLLGITLSPASGARARVVVSGETETTYTISVEIDLVGGEDDIAARWNKAIRDYWNDGPGLGRFKFCGKSVDFVPDIKPIAAGQRGRPDAATIRMELLDEGEEFISNVRGLDPTRNSTGTWGSNESDATIAHEFGHILGLPDEYVWVPYTDRDKSGSWDPGEPLNDDLDHDGKRDPGEPTRPAPGMRGSLMAEARGKVLQRHIDTALSGIRGLGCQKWEGNIHLQTDQTLASGDTCQQTGDAQGELLVTADGRITGTLDAVETETCTFGFDRTRSGLTLALEGTASASALTVSHTTGTTTGYFLFGFFSAPGVLDPVPIPITAPGVAEGSVTREFPGVNYMTITLTFDFRCVTCEAAVG